MNDSLQRYARKEIKKGLSKVSDDAVSMFKRLYSRGSAKADLNGVVDAIPEDSLDSVMVQVQNTIEKEERVNRKYYGALKEECDELMRQIDVHQVNYAEQGRRIELVRLIIDEEIAKNLTRTDSEIGYHQAYLNVSGWMRMTTKDLEEEFNKGKKTTGEAIDKAANGGWKTSGKEIHMRREDNFNGN